jgi:hypothetical protein
LESDEGLTVTSPTPREMAWVYVKRWKVFWFVSDQVYVIR